MRTCGASLSVYEISADDYENLDDYVAKLHESFAVALRQTIHELNSKGLFEGQGMHAFRVRLIDKAR